MHLFPITDIIVKPGRTREEFNRIPLEELEASILEKGLIHPVSIEHDTKAGEYYLLCGERRLKCLQNLYGKAQTFRHGRELIPFGKVPVVLYKDLTEVERLEIEIEENLRRIDLTWQERTAAIASLARLRKGQDPKITETAIAQEIAKTTGKSESHERQQVAKALLLDQFKNDPTVQKARSQSEAWTALQGRLQAQFQSKLREQIDATHFSDDVVSPHELHHGDCLAILPTIPDESFDTILCDPPYGISANKMTRQKTARHFYDDSEETARDVAFKIIEEGFRVAKENATLFMFCTPNLWHELYDKAEEVGWAGWRRPLIWHKSREGLTPWGTKGFTYTYEMILFACKGRQGLLDSRIDVLDYYRSQRGKLHGAQKPVALYEELLRVSTLPGGRVLDPCCGSGTSFIAGNRRGVIVTGIEMERPMFEVASARMSHTEEDEYEKELQRNGDVGQGVTFPDDDLFEEDSSLGA